VGAERRAIVAPDDQWRTVLDEQRFHRYRLDIWLYLKHVLDCLLRGESGLASLRADRWAKPIPSPSRVDPRTARRGSPLRHRRPSARRARWRQSGHNGSGQETDPGLSNAASSHP